MSDSFQPHGLYYPWNSPGKSTGVGCHSLLQGIFPTQGLNRGLPISWATREAVREPRSSLPKKFEKQRRWHQTRIHIANQICKKDQSVGQESWGKIKVKKKLLTNITTYHGRVSASRNTVLASSPHRHFAKNWYIKMYLIQNRVLIKEKAE